MALRTSAWRMHGHHVSRYLKQLISQCWSGVMFGLAIVQGTHYFTGMKCYLFFPLVLSNLLLFFNGQSWIFSWGELPHSNMIYILVHCLFYRYTLLSWNYIYFHFRQVLPLSNICSASGPDVFWRVWTICTIFLFPVSVDDLHTIRVGVYPFLPFWLVLEIFLMI